MTETRRTKILIAEDSEDLLNIWTTLFDMKTDFQIKACRNGAQALECLRLGFTPEILITDYYLGDKTGVELISEARRDHPDLHCIMITGNHDDENLELLHKRGEITLLIKPVKFPLMLEAIKDCLETSPSRPANTEVHCT